LSHDVATDPEQYQLFIPQEDPLARQPRDGKILVRDTRNVGAYRLKGNRGGPVLRGFAVNYPASQSDLQRLSVEDLNELLGPDRYQLARNQQEIEFGVRNKRIGQEFYPFLIMLLALVLALEQTLANRFYRKEPATEQAVETRPALVATEVQA